MRRILLVLSVAALMAAMLAASAMPAFALPGGIANDDKNNPTYPGDGVGNNRNISWEAIFNTIENCSKQGAKGHTPATCE
jgi:hypothetical protein